MKNVIYKIKNTVNDKIYIGSAVNFISRKRIHLSCLKKGKHHSRILQNHVNKYGIDCLYFEVIEYDCLNLIEREQFYIDTFKPYFNIRKIAHSNFGLKRTPEQIQNIINGRIKSGSYKIGKKRTPEQIAKMGWHNKGKKLSIHQIEAIKRANTGRKMTQQQKDKISKKLKGKVPSDETKYKLSKKLTGNRNWLKVNYKCDKRSVKISKSLSIPILQIKDGVTVKEWESAKQAALSLGISRGNISSCVNGKRKKVIGYEWRKK